MTLSSPPGDATASLRAVVQNVERVVHGQSRSIRLALVAMLAEGHLLLEDVPGTGKTTLARALARSIDLDFRRIQFTSDLLPADVLGLSVQASGGAFEFHPGPIFTHLVLADELNRTPPRTQSALLECMNERHVSIEGQTRELPRPFLVIATQNPLEFEGTYPLPESQLDRFLMRIELGAPSREHERRILQERRTADPLDTLEPVLTRSQWLDECERVRHVRIADELLDYLLSIVEATRTSGRFLSGASTRAALALQRAAQASAALVGRDFCVPDDVRELVLPVLAHRLQPEIDVHDPSMDTDPAALLAEILDEVPVPE